jgi:PAS domain S-box-containing protein
VTSAIYDALSATELNNFLRRAIEVIVAALPADHVLVQDLGAIDANSRFNSSVGWDRAAAAEIALTLVELSQQPGTALMEDITPDDGLMQGRIYIPSAMILEKYNLAAGMLLIMPSMDGNLVVFAGRSEPGSVFTGSDAVLLQSMLNMLSPAIESEHAELAHFRNMQQAVQAKHQWESTLDALPQVVCLIDENGDVLRSNRTLEAWRLGDVTSVKGKQVHDVIHPGCSDWQCTLKARFEDMWRQLVNTDFVECEYHNSSMPYDLRCSINKCKKSQYEDGDEEVGYAFLVIEDISLQKHAERVMQDYNEELEKRLQERTMDLTNANAALRSEIEDHLRDGDALRASEKKYTCLVETTLTGLYVMQNDHIVFCNNRFAEIFGYTQKEISTLDMQVLFPQAETGLVAEMKGAISDAAWVSDEHVIKGATRDGRTLWLQSNLTRVDCSNEIMIMGNIIDITEQKNTEDALRRSQYELKVLSGKLMEAQEAERKRIAAELHDSIGQSISAIKFGIENALRKHESSSHGAGNRYLRGAIDKLRDTIDEVRNISMNLRPSILDDLGLKATIKWFTREFVSLFPSISVDVQINVAESDLSELQKIVIFRIIQESMNNIGKHADASNVSIKLLYAGDKLALSVKDYGRGISAETLCAGQGFGLSSMRDRVKLTNGEFSIESTPGAGALILATWPGTARH